MPGKTSALIILEQYLGKYIFLKVGDKHRAHLHTPLLELVLELFLMGIV